MKLLPYVIGCMYLTLSCSVDQDTNARRYLEDSAVSSGDARAAKLKTTIALKEPIFSQDFGLAPNDKIDGKSLFEVLTSQKAGREDGKTCAECHSNDVALGDYWVPSASNEALDDIDPDSEVAEIDPVEAFDEDSDDFDGARLRRSRLHRGLEIDDIATVTKVNPTYLRFLEEERFEDLPARVYVRGFLMAYASAVGIDPPALASSYLQRFDGVVSGGKGTGRRG